MTLGLLLARPPLPMLSVLAQRPTSALPESLLERGYACVGPDILESACLCGGVIRCEDWAIASAVHRHNETTAHAAWAVAAGWR